MCVWGLSHLVPFSCLRVAHVRTEMEHYCWTLLNVLMGDVGRVCFSLVQVLNLQHHCLRFQKSGSERWGVERPLSHTELLLWVSTLSTWAALLWGRTSLGLVHALNSFVHSTAVDTVSRATSQPSYLTGLLKKRTQAITTAAIFWSRTRGAGNSSV